jgi:hypothetical protein
LIVLALAPAIAEGNDLTNVGQIRKTLDHDPEHIDLKGELSDVPVMQLEVRKAVEQDRVIYNAVGFAGRHHVEKYVELEIEPPEQAQYENDRGKRRTGRSDHERNSPKEGDGDQAAR